jgi:HPt (histidine-containing phosphotransfer) domain-containing protein
MNTDPTSQTTITERVQQLGVRFIQRCLEETSQMQTCAAQIRSDVENVTDSEEIDFSPLRQLEHIAHRIHGTGASFGYARLSECGGEIERLAEQLIQTEMPLDGAACEALDRSLERLSREIHAITATQGLR